MGGRGGLLNVGLTVCKSLFRSRETHSSPLALNTSDQYNLRRRISYCHIRRSGAPAGTRHCNDTFVNFQLSLTTPPTPPKARLKYNTGTWLGRRERLCIYTLTPPSVRPSVFSNGIPAVSVLPRRSAFLERRFTLYLLF